MERRVNLTLRPIGDHVKVSLHTNPSFTSLRPARRKHLPVPSLSTLPHASESLALLTSSVQTLGPDSALHAQNSLRFSESQLSTEVIKTQSPIEPSEKMSTEETETMQLSTEESMLIKTSVMSPVLSTIETRPCAEEAPAINTPEPSPLTTAVLLPIETAPSTEEAPASKSPSPSKTSEPSPTLSPIGAPPSTEESPAMVSPSIKIPASMVVTYIKIPASMQEVHVSAVSSIKTPDSSYMKMPPLPPSRKSIKNQFSFTPHSSILSPPLQSSTKSPVLFTLPPTMCQSYTEIKQKHIEWVKMQTQIPKSIHDCFTHWRNLTFPDLNTLGYAKNNVNLELIQMMTQIQLQLTSMSQAYSRENARLKKKLQIHNEIHTKIRRTWENKYKTMKNSNEELRTQLQDIKDIISRVYYV